MEINNKIKERNKIETGILHKYWEETLARTTIDKERDEFYNQAIINKLFIFNSTHKGV